MSVHKHSMTRYDRVTHPSHPLGFHSLVIEAATAERPEPPDVEHAGRVPVRVSMGKWQVGDGFF